MLEKGTGTTHAQIHASDWLILFTHRVVGNLLSVANWYTHTVIIYTKFEKSVNL